MIHLSIQHKKHPDYGQSSAGKVKGTAFYGDSLYCGDRLLELISSWQNEEQYVEGLKQLNGFYALISNTGKQLFAAVDRVRSVPLFYGQKGTEFYLSDSADWVRQQVGNTVMDPMASNEFLLTGYVTGADTLFPDVRQLQAGEAISVQDDGEKLTIKPIRYYGFKHEYITGEGMEELMERYDRVLRNIFDRLIEYAQGRTLVVPLSGGHDSRLIVLMLKRLGYEKIITFSYGRAGNKESEVSQKVARSLDLCWEFVPYSNKDWYQWFRSEEFKEYLKMAGGLCTLGHEQDWPAVWELKKKKLIPEDSIFVPGHSADLLAGSRSSNLPQIYHGGEFALEPVVNAIIWYHYSLYDWSDRDLELRPMLEKRITQVLDPARGYPDNASAFEAWDISERQAKFIINSLRVYEFWGYQWWIPYWDYEYMQFWSSVPLKYRLNEVMHSTFIDNLFNISTTNVPLSHESIDSTEPAFRKLLLRLLSRPQKEMLKRIVRSNKISMSYKYYTDKLAAWGIYNLEEYLSTARGYSNVNSALTREYLKIIGREGL